jgi:hypothetical protein
MIGMVPTLTNRAHLAEQFGERGLGVQCGKRRFHSDERYHNVALPVCLRQRLQRFRGANRHGVRLRALERTIGGLRVGAQRFGARLQRLEARNLATSPCLPPLPVAKSLYTLGQSCQAPGVGSR